MSLTLLLRDRPVSIEIYITKLLVVLIIARRSIIPGERYLLALSFISIVVARNMQPACHLLAHGHNVNGIFCLNVNNNKKV